ncbi:MAG TPA: hypothetical protein PKV21_06720 [bacterium]|nr:hypothetical protein [bacterium]
MKKLIPEKREKMLMVKKIVKEAVIEAFEDIGLSKAIEEGLKTEKVDKEKIFEVLNKKL